MLVVLSIKLQRIFINKLKINKLLINDNDTFQKYIIHTQVKPKLKTNTSNTTKIIDSISQLSR